MGSSKLIEYFIALFVGLLAILAGLFVIGFLLVDPLREPNGIDDTAPLRGVLDECNATVSTVNLPPGCLFDGQTFFERAVCGQGFCTTMEGVCSDASRMCCCRPLDESRISLDETVECNELAPILTVNATICGCSVCDDLFITVRVTVANAENNEEVISGAQIFNISDDSSPIFLGVTANGQLEFVQPFDLNSITLQVLAANFLTTNMTVNLGPGPIQVTVLLTPLVVIEVGLGNSALTVRLGSNAAVSTPANSFVSGDGTPYDELVMYEGVFVDDPDNIGTTLPLGAQQFVINNNVSEPFVAVAVLSMLFRDVEGGVLQVNGLDFVIATSLDQIFIAYFRNGTWENGGDLIPLGLDDARRKRQAPGGTPVFVFPDVEVGVFAAIAVVFNAECWLQARTFDDSGVELSGTFITIEQCTISNGLFMFGTDTGTAQTMNDGLVNNAICLPMACDNFTSATLSATDTIGGNPLTPNDFPLATFNPTEDPPIAIGDIFSIQEVVTASAAGEPRPFYFGFAACVSNGQEATMTADLADYFRFNSGTPPAPPTLNCYVKIQVLDCFDNNVVTVTSLDPNNNILGETTVTVNDTNATDPDSTSGDITGMPMTPFCNASIATIRTVCIPFVCQSTIVVDVAQNPASSQVGNCENTGRSVIVSLPIISDPDTTELIIDTSSLRSDDFNDPDLGLFHDMTDATVAQGRCFAGNSSTAAEIDLTTGIAGTFTCFQV